MPLWIYLLRAVEIGVLLLLVGLSVWSVKIMIERARVFRELDSDAALADAKRVLEARDSRQLEDWVGRQKGLLAGTLRAALSTQSGGATLDAERVDRAVGSYLADARAELERGFTVLATLGSNAPFIGLFGTVLGIIQAFATLSGSADGAAGAGGTTAVMSNISSALVATAAGLFVAIPAVVAYNVFTEKLRAALTRCEALRDLLIAVRK